MSHGFVWATVTSVGPLRVKIDGDSAALPFVPDSLIDPLELAVGTRVRCELSARQLVILGKSGGGVPDRLKIAQGYLTPTNTDANTVTSTGFYAFQSGVNTPSDNWWHMEVQQLDLNWIMQTAREITGAYSYRRYRVSGSWTAWLRLYETEPELDGRYAQLSQVADRSYSGTFVTPALSAGGVTTVAVTYPVGRFTATPVKVADSGEARVTVGTGAHTSSGVTLVLFNATGASSSTAAGSIIANQGTASSGIG